MKMRTSGGGRTRAVIAHSRPFVGRAEQQACARVVASGQLAQDGEVSALEHELSSLVGHRRGIAVSSGTAALYLALKALGAGPGDRVIIPSYVCTALLNAVIAVGAAPALCDVDPCTGVMTADNVKKALARRTRAVIVPHLFGYPADVRGISLLGVPVIEDCAQCVGATRAGACAGGQTAASVFSFYATKLIAAGEGGMVATSDSALAARIERGREYDNRAAYDPGFNYKLSDVHAAIARCQISKLSAMIRARRRIADAYDQMLGDIAPPLHTSYNEGGVRPVHFRYVVRVKGGVDALVEGMAEKGIACRRPVYKPLHRYLRIGGLPGTEDVYRHALSLPIYPGLAAADVDRVCHCLRARLSSN
jgi:perosamine synthetase